MVTIFLYLHCYRVGGAPNSTLNWAVIHAEVCRGRGCLGLIRLNDEPEARLFNPKKNPKPSTLGSLYTYYIPYRYP